MIKKYIHRGFTMTLTCIAENRSTIKTLILLTLILRQLQGETIAAQQGRPWMKPCKEYDVPAYVGETELNGSFTECFG